MDYDDRLARGHGDASRSDWHYAPRASCFVLAAISRSQCGRMAPPDLAAMNSAQLDQLSAALMQDCATIAALESLLKAVSGANKAVLNSVRS